MNGANEKTSFKVGGYIFALGMVMAALFLRWLVDPIFGNQLPFWTFWLAIGVVVWRTGLGPALVATVLGLVVGAYFFVAPRNALTLFGTFNLAIFGAYVTVSATLCALGVVMRSAQRRSELQYRKILAQKESMEHEAREREQSETLLRIVLDTLPVGVWILNAQGLIVGGNPAGREIWGGAKYVGVEGFGEYKGWWTDTGKQIEPQEWSAARAITKGETSLNEEIEIEAFDGTRKIILNAAVPLRDSKGGITGAILLNQDITGRKRSETGLARQNYRIALLHEAAAHLLSSEGQLEDIAGLYQRVADFSQADAFFEYATDASGQNLDLQLAGGISEESRERLRHLAFAQCICHAMPEQRRAVLVCNIQESDDPAVQVVKSLGIRAYSCHPLQAGDRLLGTLAFASRQRDAFGPEDQDFFQTVARYVAVARERARLMAELRRHTEQLEELVAERTARLHTIVETAADGIITIDEYGTIETVNPAAERIFGYTTREMVGQNVKMLMPEPDHGKHDDYLAHYRETGERRIIGHGREVEGKRKDGSIFPLDLAVSESWIGARRFFTGLLRDISQRKETEKRLRDATEELEQFSYSIIHDMRAPLRAMVGFGNILNEEHTSHLDEEGRDYLRRIITSAQRMDHLILDALSYSKVLREGLPLDTIDAGTLLQEMVESYPQFQPPRTEIDMAKEFPRVTANYAGLTQCFSNLLNNAIKFGKPHQTPRVRIWAEKQEEFVRFWFEDNGIGIAPEHQHRIFGMYQRLNAESEGTGIGLALVRKVVERMNGTVGVESKLGEGSRFWVELPIAENDEQRNPSIQARDGSHQTAKVQRMTPAPQVGVILND